jgi:hypothetical protein
MDLGGKKTGYPSDPSAIAAVRMNRGRMASKSASIKWQIRTEKRDSIKRG